MSELNTEIQEILVTGENLISFVDDLRIETGFVPSGGVEVNSAVVGSGALALTNLRIIVVLVPNSKIKKYLHIIAVTSLVERPLTNEKPGWPYQAILSTAGGRIVIVETRKPNPEHAKKLSSLLVEGLMRFGVRKDDDSSIAAAYVQEQRRRQQD